MTPDSRRLSRIGLRLLAFNLLVVFVPVAGILYLGIYESRLREAQEAGLVQQARVLAAALGGAALDGERIAQVFVRLERRSDARFRVYDTSGALIADSARQSAGTVLDDRAKSYGGEDVSVRRRLLYRLGAWVADFRNWFASFPASPSSAPGRTAPVPASGPPPEVKAALEGRYGAATRVTAGQRSVTLFSAVPVRRDGAVIGAVVASQSTFRLLSTLYAIRLRTFEIIAGSVLAAALLTALAAMTVVRPLARLRRQAADVAERRGALPARFDGAERRDEIGDLARGLGELSRRTNDHIRLLETFSADVSHELKNPLASIRTAAETMAESDDHGERERFLQLMLRDVARLERLVSGLRDVARVEGQIEADVSVALDAAALVREFVDTANRSAARGVHVALTAPGPATVRASRERLGQVIDNVIANAVSFSPPSGSVGVSVRADGGRVLIAVEDEGPGIPPAHLDRVFERFFSYRPGDGAREHVGLGLAIARQIVESYGGTITAANRDPRGARFEIAIPIAAPR
jgi:two-component system sensor histidine kinase ChvG